MTDKKQEVAFLADEFELPAARAAAVIAESEDEAEVLTAAQLEQDREHDPYGESPVPASPEDKEVAFNGGLQKTVLKRANKAGRVGP